MKNDHTMTNQPRREWLKQNAALGAALAGGALPALAQAPTKTGNSASGAAPVRAWQNWAKTEQFQPKSWWVPNNEAELIQRLRAQPAEAIRCVGAGHSFTGLVPTEGSIVSLDRLSGIIHVDRQAMTVRVHAGTRIGVLARALHEQGLALSNQPDIDVQSLAGAMATATHGTGMTLPAIHDQVVGLRMVTMDGQVHECDHKREPELFDAARVSLGALGIITEFTLKVRPRFMLKRRIWLEPLDTLLARAVPKLLSTPRAMHFTESEFHVPRAVGIKCVKEVLATLERRNEVFYPIEFRYVKGDNAWLTPFAGGDYCSIACHAKQGEEYGYLTSDLGPIFRRYGGRPHWGKLHDLGRDELAARYPRLPDFERLRQSLDPQGRLLNKHLKTLMRVSDVS
ncbi:MAG: hypothetical protein C4K60_17795 [Ideonella sp. MAG2]|nr:MAG: hypothetical protein C4K60_17795 [Ideonella sp. MAG2]